MPGEIPLNHDAFRFLASRGGLDNTSAHLDELYSFVQEALAGLRSLDEIDVGGAEPDLIFSPLGEVN